MSAVLALMLAVKYVITQLVAMHVAATLDTHLLLVITEHVMVCEIPCTTNIIIDLI